MPHTQRAPLRRLAAAAALALALSPTAAQPTTAKLPDVCDGKFVRPILLIPGFLGVPLFDAANDFDPEWPDVDAFGQKVAPGKTDLDMPMTWKGMTQDKSTVGPESMPNDKFPSMDTTLGKLFTGAVYSQLRRLASSQKHPKDASIPMFWTVAYDWRRDFYEQAERVMLRLENVYAETGCRPVMVGHSFGGLLAYMTIARYQERAARVAAGVLYATAPFQGSSPKVHDLTVDDDVTQSLARPPQDTLFTFPSVYVLGPSAKTTCWHANALLANVTKNCAPEAFQTGVNCDSPKCGRPADWPADRPFFLPFDLQDPAVWLRIGCARPVLDHVTEKEKKHLQKALETARRTSDLVSGPLAEAAKKVHPPGAIISIRLEDPEEKPANMPAYITCDPSPSFGDPQATERWCEDLRYDGKGVGDGTLLGFSQELHGPGWERSVQIYRMTKKPEDWPPPLRGPHAASLLFAENSFRPLDCKATPLLRPDCTADGAFPSLEQVLCSLVHRANLAASGEAAPEGDASCPNPILREAGGRTWGQWLEQVRDSSHHVVTRWWQGR